MSRRKPLSEVKGHRTKAEKARRAALEAGVRPDAVPAPIPSGNSLADFLADVRVERLTFDERLRPKEGETVCRCPSGQPYAWPEGDAPTIARQYALDVIEKRIVAGELIQYAAKRFLADLDNGHSRGLYFDPVAARNACCFAEGFCGLTLMPWQVWVLTEIFGWKKATGFRRFQEAWLSVARKNGKTTFASAVALFLLIADEEKYAEVYAAATAREQSRIVWRDAKRAVGASPELAAAVKRWAGDLEVEATDNHFQPLASEDRSFLGVRAHGIIADEVGVWQDRNSWDVLVQSTVSRKQPLALAITTAPEDKRTFAWEKFTWVERILRGVIEADHVFAAIYTIDAGDDPKNVAVLGKANPSMGVTLFEENLAKQIAELAETPSGLNNWLQFHCNVTPERSINQLPSIASKNWDACSHLELLPDAKDPSHAYDLFVNLNARKHVWLGLDVGTVSDMTAIAFLWRSAYLRPHKQDGRGVVTEWAEEHPRRFLLVDYFMPEAGLLEKERKWRVPLSTWVRQGFIDLIPGDMVDDRVIQQYLVETVAKKLCVYDLGFDVWQAKTMCAEINERKVFSCVAVPQIPSVLTPAIKEFLADIRRGELCHFNNPVLRWNAENVYFGELDNTAHGGLKPTKCGNNETLKIDGISAAIDAYARMLDAPPPSSPRVFSL